MRPFLREALIAGAVVGAVLSLPAAGLTSASEFLVRVWDSENGLPRNKVESVLQTRDGYLWVGTQRGLRRFDGRRFIRMDDAAAAGSHDYAAPALEEDARDGSLWIGTTQGLFHFRGRRVDRFTIEDGLPHGNIHKILSLPSGDLWLETETDLTRYRQGAFKVFKSDGGLPPSRPDWMTRGPEGELLLGKAMWRCRFDAARDQFVRLDIPGVPDSLEITALRFSHDGEWMIGTPDGLLRGRDGQWTRLGMEHGLRKSWIHCIHEDPLNGLWVATRGDGVYHWEDGAFRAVPLSDSAAASVVDSLIVDREGSLWAASLDGLIQIRKRDFAVYAEAQGLVADRVNTVCAAANGTVWVGADRGLSWVRKGAVEKNVEVDLLRSKGINSIAVTGNGAVWMSVAYLGRLDADGRSGWDMTSADRLGGVEALYVDRLDRLWVGTPAGVQVWDNGLKKPETEGDVEPPGGADVFCEDHAGSLWYANGRGLHRRMGRRVDSFELPCDRPRPRIKAIAGDAKGQLWIGTERGLFRWAGGEWFHFTTAHGLVEERVHSVVADDVGGLWLGGAQGIYRFARGDLEQVAEGGRSEVRGIAFGRSDGLLSVETPDLYQPNACKAPDGRLWFATRRGVAVVDPCRIDVSEVPPLVVVEQVRADDQVIFGDGMREVPARPRVRRPEDGEPGEPTGRGLGGQVSMRLGPGRARRLEIHFTANSFVAPERIRFKYRLEGHEPEWRESTSDKRSEIYTNLRPGTYQFRVMACNSRGIWSGTNDDFTFTRDPAFTETPWFPASLVFCGVVASLGLAGWRLRWQRRVWRAQESAAVAAERARISRDLHDELGASLTGIALEMEAVHRRGAAQGDQLAVLASDTRALANGLRELAWAINPRCDHLGSLGTFVGELTERFCSAARLECQLELPATGDARPVPARVRHELLAVVKEGLANIAKHAAARTVLVTLAVSGQEVSVQLRDDGAGFDPARANGGNGLQNLKERVAQAGGALSANSRPGSGTVLAASFPLNIPVSRDP